MQDLDDDAMLIGAQFCSDSFTSISPKAFNKGVSYSFYARLVRTLKASLIYCRSLLRNANLILSKNIYVN